MPDIGTSFELHCNALRCLLKWGRFKDLQEKGTSVHVFVQDLSEQQAASRLYDQIAQAGLTIDLLINNAGFGIWGGFEETPLTEYSRMLQVNINALTELCHLFIPNMIKQKESGIINVASTAAFVPIPFAAAYSASKSYVLMLTEALHGEYNQHGLQAMTLCPGGTASNFAAVAGGKDNTSSSALASSEEVAEAAIAAFLKGDLYTITGKGNKKIALLPRLLTRNKTLEIVGNAWKKTLGRA